MASYPTSVKSFTTKNNGLGNTIDAAHVNDLQSEVTAIEQDLITGVPVARGGTGNVTLTANGVLVGNGTGAIVATSTGVTGQILTAVTGAAPSFQAIETENAVVAMQVFN